MNESVLPELPGSWVWTTIEDFLLSLESGGRPKGGVRSIKEGIPSIGGEHLLYNGRFDFTDIRYVPREFYEKMNRGKILKRDVLVVKDGATTGKTSFVPDSFPFDKAAVNEHVFILRVLEQYSEPKYLFFWMQSSFGQKCVKDNFQGTAQGGINSIFVRNSNFPLPPLPEQRRIVTKLEELFTRLDAGVSELKKTQAQLKRYRQSVLKAACEGKLVPTEAELAKDEGREYEPAEVLIGRILKERREKWNGKGKYKEATAPDTNGLYQLPEGWCWVRLDSLAALKGGITKDQNRKIANARKIPYLRVANVQRGYLDLSEIKEIEAQESVISELLLKSGDILFNEGGDRDKLGRGCIWNGEIKECIYQNHIFRGRIYSTDISNKIISWFGNTFGQQYFMKEGKQTTNLASINLTKLSAFPVPLPPLAEQHRIVAEVERRLSIADGVEKTVSQSLAQAERLRQSILKKAFEGRLVAQDASDEPAGVLLERIRQQKQIKEKTLKPKKRNQWLIEK